MLGGWVLVSRQSPNQPRVLVVLFLRMWLFLDFDKKNTDNILTFVFINSI